MVFSGVFFAVGLDFRLVLCPRVDDDADGVAFLGFGDVARTLMPLRDHRELGREVSID